MSASREFGVVVRIEQDSITVPAESLHRSHKPANANRESSCIPKWNGCFSLPLCDHSKKTVRRKQAPAAREGIAEGGFISHRLRAGIDCLEADAGVAGPGRNQAPASQREVPLRCRWILANNSDGLRRGDVVARLPIDLVVGVEVFCDQLLASGQTIAATHYWLLESNSKVELPTLYSSVHDWQTARRSHRRLQPRCHRAPGHSRGTAVGRSPNRRRR